MTGMKRILFRRLQKVNSMKEEDVISGDSVL